MNQSFLLRSSYAILSILHSMDHDVEAYEQELVAVGRIRATVLIELFSICVTKFSGTPEVYRQQT